MEKCNHDVGNVMPNGGRKCLNQADLREVTTRLTEAQAATICSNSEEAVSRWYVDNFLKSVSPISRKHVEIVPVRIY